MQIFPNSFFLKTLLQIVCFLGISVLVVGQNANDFNNLLQVTKEKPAQEAIPIYLQAFQLAMVQENPEACYNLGKALTVAYKDVAIDSALVWSVRTFEAAILTKNYNNIISSIIDVSFYEFRTLDYIKATHTAEAAQRLLIQYPNDSLYCVLLYRLGEGYEYTDRHKQGVRAFSECYQMADSLGNYPYVVKIGIKLGSMQKVTGNIPEAILHFTEAVKTAEQIKDTEPQYYFDAKLSLLELMAWERVEGMDVNKFCSDIEIAIEEVKKLGMLNYLPQFLETQKYCYIKRGDREKINEIKLLPIAIINESKKELESKFRDFQAAANVALHQNKIEAALAYVREAKKLANKADNIPMKITIIEIEQNIHIQQKEFEKANECQQLIQKHKDKLRANARMQSVENLENKVQLLEQTKETELLAKEKEILKNSNRLYGLGLISLALISFLLFLSWGITKQKNWIIENQNDELSDQKKRLQELNQTKDKILRIIGHDLKKPGLAFRGISRKINYLIKENDLETLQALGSDLDNTTQSMNTLLDNLLAWGQIQDTVIRTTPINLNIKLTLENIIDSCQVAFQEKNINISAEIENLFLMIDPKVFKSIALNILDNAIKFSETHSTIHIKLFEKGSKVFLKIDDEGVGMTQKQIDELDTVFEGKSMLGTAGEEGTGIGLFLVHEMIKLCNAKLDVKSEIGKGTQVEIEFDA